jgi:hypothetical protein
MVLGIIPRQISMYPTMIIADLTQKADFYMKNMQFTLFGASFLATFRFYFVFFPIFKVQELANFHT